MAESSQQYLFIGGLRQDYCITHDGRVFLGVLGGNAVYGAVGARCWTSEVRIVSRVGHDYPLEWFDDLEHIGIDASGVMVLDEPADTRTFYAYLNQEERVDTHPAKHFLKIGRELPKALVDYHTSTEGQGPQNGYNPLTIRPNDLPDELQDVVGAHLAPADYLTHTTIPFRLREKKVRHITLDPSVRYMDPSFDRELPVVLSGLDAFLPSEMEARAFFHSKEMDIWEMAETFGTMGVKYVVIKQGPRGQSLWIREAGERWQIPAYPSRVRDVTGAGDAYCGGFLVGLAETEDPVEAALWGSISASLAVEGSGALYALDAAPGLIEARLEALRPALRKL
jgi:sugar/nucleoside kinase (ribokinase family)